MAKDDRILYLLLFNKLYKVIHQGIVGKSIMMRRFAVVALVEDENFIAQLRDTFSEANPVIGDPEYAMQNDQGLSAAVFFEM
jgi:hypothetical protein